LSLFKYILQDDRPTARKILQTPWRTVLPEKPLVTQPLKKFHAFYVAWSFNSVFTRVRYQSLSWARIIQSIPSYIRGIKSVHKIFWPVEIRKLEKE